MKTMLGYCGLGLLAAAISGCAVEGSGGASREERVGATSQADTAGYLQTFDPYFQSLIFQPSVAIDWVVLHVTIGGTRTTNVRMPQTGTSAAAGPSYEIESLPVLPGDSVVYSFTYSVNGLAYDTPQVTYALPTTWAPTTFFTEVAQGEIAAVSTQPLAWADAHYRINGGPELNVRLAQQGSRYVQPVALSAGDVLEYSVTYSTGIAVFDTAPARYTATSGVTRFVVDQSTDSAGGRCVANGDSRGQCNLRAAVLAAGATTGPSTIELEVDAAIGAGPISLAGASPVVIESAAGGAVHALTGGGTSRLFEVATGATVTLGRLSISGFHAVDSGAAIVNAGALGLEGVTVADNATLCSGTGAMTAFASCSGGAIASSGTLTLGGGTTFANNTVTANAGAAAYTTAWAGGGAITSSGTIAIVGPVTFTGNAANAGAHSGYHPAPIGGADASAAGGAIYTTGTLTVTAPAGTCQFTKNSASASASTVNGGTTVTSQGGAIENTGTLQIPGGACVFSDDSAGTGADIDG